MRLPWPFGRRSPSDGPSPAAPEGASPSAPSAPRDLTAPPTGAWTSLPPIQRTVGDPPLVAPSSTFLDGVPGHRPLPPIVQALGHETGPAAPPGLVLAKPSPVPSLTSHAPMPVQRRAAAVPGVVPETWSEPEPTAESGPPARRLPAVSASATVTPSPLPLTQAPAVPQPVAQRSAAGGMRTASPAPAATHDGGHSPAAVSSPSLPSPRAARPARAGRWAEHPTAGPASPGLGAPLPASHPGHGVLAPGRPAHVPGHRECLDSHRDPGGSRHRPATRGPGQPDDGGAGHLGQPAAADGPGAGRPTHALGDGPGASRVASIAGACPVAGTGCGQRTPPSPGVGRFQAGKRILCLGGRRRARPRSRLAASCHGPGKPRIRRIDCHNPALEPPRTNATGRNPVRGPVHPGPPAAAHQHRGAA